MGARLDVFFVYMRQKGGAGGFWYLSEGFPFRAQKKGGGGGSFEGEGEGSDLVPPFYV